MRQVRALLAAVALPCVASVAAAQGSPVRIELEGPGSRVSRGALRCAIGDETQFSLNGLDSADQRVVLQQYLPEVTSSDERVMVATLDEDSPYIVNATCKADGEAWILIHAGDAKLEFPALVGKARSRATPRSRGESAAATPTTRPGAATPGAQAVAPATATRATGMQGQQISGVTANETRGTVLAKPAVADAPAVAATGLVLYAGYNNVQLTWKPAPGAAGYRVARKDVAANDLVTLTGDNVTADGTGLVRDTTFFDGSAVADRQYVYYLATYFQKPNGDFYFPDRNSEARGVATPRSSEGRPWLPADWRDRPQPRALTVIANNTIDARWHSKSRVAGYIYFTYVVTAEDPQNSCAARAHIIVGLSPSLPGHSQVIVDSSMVKNIPSMTSLVDPPLEGERRRRGQIDAFGRETLPVTMYCVAVHAVYPEQLDGTGTPVVVGFNKGVEDAWNADEGLVSKALWFAVARSCPSAMTDSTCTPWKPVPSADIVQMHQ